MTADNFHYIGLSCISILDKIRSQHRQHLIGIPIHNLGVLRKIPRHLIIPARQDIIHGIGLSLFLQKTETNQFLRHSLVSRSFRPVPYFAQSQHIEYRQLTVIRQFLLDALHEHRKPSILDSP